MASKIDEQILNVFLDELHGEKQPPDLTEKILRRHRNGEVVSDASFVGEVFDDETFDDKASNTQSTTNGQKRFKFKGQQGPSEAAPAIQAVKKAKNTSVIQSADSKRPSLELQAMTKKRKLIWVLSLASALLVAVSLAITLVLVNGSGNEIADGPDNPNRDVNTLIPDGVDPDRVNPNGVNPDEAVVNDERTGNSEPLDPFNNVTDEDPVSPIKDGLDTGNRSEVVDAINNYPILQPGELVRPPLFSASRDTTTVAYSPRELTDRINATFTANWESSNLTPANSLIDEAWLVRVSNRLIGETPAADEILPLRNKLADEGRHAIVKYLMTDDKFRPRFLDHWSQMLAMKLIGLRPELSVNDDQNLADLKTYLRQSLEENKPWDQIAYELVSAVGSLDQESSDFNPAASYLMLVGKRLGAERTYWTSHVSQTFMNQNSRCSQCHSSADEQLAQKEFFDLHSYFAQTQFVKHQDDSVVLMNMDFLPEGRASLEEAALAFEQDGKQVLAFPALADRPASSRSGLVKEFDRRTELATHIANSDEWRRSLTNHVWMLLLNSPLNTGDEHDRLRGLEEELAVQIAANNYSIEPMIESIVLSTVFDLGIGNDEVQMVDNPIVGTPASFSQFYDYPMSFRRANEALAIVEDAYNSSVVDLPAMRGVLAQRSGAQQQTKPKVLQIKEGLPEKLAAWAQSPRNSDVLQRISSSSMSDRQKIEHLVLAALKRPAREEEIKHAEAILAKAQNKQEAMQDIWWALFNSFEFTWSDGIR